MRGIKGLSSPLVSRDNKVQARHQPVTKQAEQEIESPRQFENLLRVREYQKRQSPTGLLDPLAFWRG